MFNESNYPFYVVQMWESLKNKRLKLAKLYNAIWIR